jgi:hypothetical protein
MLLWKASLGLSVLVNRGVAQPGSAPRSGRGGRRFESSHPDQALHLPAVLGFIAVCCLLKPRNQT